VAQTAVVFLLPQKVKVGEFNIYPRYMFQGLSIAGSGKTVYLNWKVMREF